MRHGIFLLPLLAALACADAEDGLTDAALRDAAAGADAGASADVGVRDAGAPMRDVGLTDLGVEDGGFEDGGADAGLADLGFEDSGVADAGAFDAGPADAGRLDAAAADAGGCGYVNVSECVVDCNGTYAYAREFREPNGRCPPFVRLNGNDYPDVRAAIAAEACSGTCLYKASQSVSFIDHCNRRNGYIVYTAANCPDLYEFSTGFFPSVADWELATPCP